MKNHTFNLKFGLAEGISVKFYIKIFYTKPPATLLNMHPIFSTLPEVEYARQILRIILFDNYIENRIRSQNNLHIVKYKKTLLEEKQAIIINSHTSICAIKKIST
jgi:hypothetical protein